MVRQEDFACSAANPKLYRSVVVVFLFDNRIVINDVAKRALGIAEYAIGMIVPERMRRVISSASAVIQWRRSGPDLAAE